MARRNPYRPGTPSYERQRRAELTRQRALAEARVRRAKSPETKRRAQRQASTARRSIREIETRQEYRDRASDRDQAAFNKLTVGDQQRLADTLKHYPRGIPGDAPDPLAGRPDRNQLWRLIYASGRGGRGQSAQRHIDDLPLEHPARRRVEEERRRRRA